MKYIRSLILDREIESRHNNMETVFTYTSEKGLHVRINIQLPKVTLKTTETQALNGIKVLGQPSNQSALSKRF